MPTDTIADMLTRIRNGLLARHDFTDMPASRLKLSLAQVLKREGYIRDFETRSDDGHKTIRVHLAYGTNREPMIMGLQRKLRHIKIHAAQLSA